MPNKKFLLASFATASILSGLINNSLFSKREISVVESLEERIENLEQDLKHNNFPYSYTGSLENEKGQIYWFEKTFTITKDFRQSQINHLSRELEEIKKSQKYIQEKREYDLNILMPQIAGYISMGTIYFKQLANLIKRKQHNL